MDYTVTCDGIMTNGRVYRRGQTIALSDRKAEILRVNHPHLTFEAIGQAEPPKRPRGRPPKHRIET